MATSPTVLTSGTLLGATASTLYTTPSNITTKLYEIILCNTDTSTTTGVTIYLVESGDSAAAKNMIFNGDLFLLQPGETKIIGMEQRLDSGTTIQGLAGDASIISIRISGDEIS